MPFTAWIRHRLGVRGSDQSRVCQECGKTYMTPDTTSGQVIVFEHDGRLCAIHPLGNVIACIEGGTL